MKLNNNSFKLKTVQAFTALSLMLGAGLAQAAPFLTEYNGQQYTVSIVNTTVTSFYSTYSSQIDNGIPTSTFPWLGASDNSNVVTFLSNVISGSVTGNFALNYNARGGLFAVNVANNALVIAPRSRDGIVTLSRFGGGLFDFVIASEVFRVTASQLLSVQSSSDAVATTTGNLNMLLYGAHSRPLSRLVAEGEKTAWIAGDWGRDDHGNRSGSSGLAEISAGYNFGPAQVNVSLGQTWASQNLIFNGDLDTDGQYVMLEAIAPISKENNIYAVLTGFKHWGDSDIRRGYLTGAALDSSKASPDTDTYGIRARVEWLDALEIKSVQLSPYADINYVKARMDSYTETGGAAPASFNSRSDGNTTMRLGFDVLRPIFGTKLNLVGNLEAAHSFDDNIVGATGSLNGTAFTAQGSKIQNDWIKAGVGLEGEIGHGKANLILNGTTRTALPNAWLSASYQMNF